MFKEYIKIAIITIAIPSLIYLAFAFVVLTFDFTLWMEHTRSAFILFTVIGYWFAGVMKIAYNDNMGK